MSNIVKDISAIELETLDNIDPLNQQIQLEPTNLILITL